MSKRGQFFRLLAVSVLVLTSWLVARPSQTMANPGIPPSVTTANVTNISPTSATLWGMLTSLGTSPSANASFQWGLSSGNYSNETRVVSFNGTGGPFVFVLSNLLSNTTYHFRAKGMGDGVGYGSDTSFTTAAAPQTAPPPFLLGWGNWGSGNTQFEYIYGVAVDASGYVYVADYYNHRVQKFTISGAFIEKWGSEGSGDGQFSYPHGIAVDTAGYVYVADEHNNRIQRFTSSGDFITKWGSYGIGDGQFRTPYGVAVDSSGYVYVADTGNNRIQKFTSSGTYITKWGNGQLQFPEAMAIDNLGNVYVADTGNNRVQKFTNSGAFIAGWGTYGSGNGQFWYPRGISADAFGNVYVAEDQNHRIQKFTSSGAFVGKWGYHGSGEGEFQFPNGVAADVLGNVYVADTGNNRIQVFATALQPSVTNKPADNITASSARLNGSLDSWGTSTFVLTNFEWGTTSGNYTTENAPSVWGNGTTGNFSTHLTDLVPNTTYFFRTRAMGDGASYGVEKSFSTDAPIPPEPLPPAPPPPPEVQWSQLFGGVNADMGWSVQQTSDDGYIIAGFTGSYEVGFDVYLIKTDSSGNLTWSQTLGGMGDQAGYSVQQTADGGYIIVGDTGSFLQGNTDVYLVKTDASGNITWTRTFGGLNPDTGSSVKQTLDGGYIISGYTTSFGAGNGDVWLIKTDASGNMTWSQTFGGTGSDSSNSIQQTVDGGYIIVGGTTSFRTDNRSDIYLVKTDASGNMTWQQNFGGLNEYYGRSVEQTTEGGYVIGGYIYNGTSDACLIKTDASGNITWSRTIGGAGSDACSSAQQTADGGYIIGGYTDSLGAGLTDAYIIKTDASGNITWQKTFGGANADQCNDIRQTADGGYIIAAATMSFGDSDGDIWLIKLGTGILPIVTTNNATNITSNSAQINGTLHSLGTTTAAPGAVEGYNIGDRAIDFQLPTLNGGNVTLSALRGNPVLVNFWATWCPPCTTEMPLLQQIDDSWSSKGLTTLAVDVNEQTATVQQFVTANNITMTVPLDSDMSVAHAYGITVIPTTLLIDRNGIIRDRVVGAFTSKEAIESRLNLVVLASANVSFEWGLRSGNYTFETPPISMNVTGNFSANLTGLSANTTYYFRAKAIGDGISYGDERSFITMETPPPFLLKWGTFGNGSGQFNSPGAVAVNAYGEAYVVDYGNNRIQKFNSAGTFITEWGIQGSGDGQFWGPTGIAVDAAGCVYVADHQNNRVQKFTGSGAFITKWGSYGSGDGQFGYPIGVAVDTVGNVYVADTGMNRVQKFTSSGEFITKWGTGGAGDGQFDQPEAIAIDARGNVYVTDYGSGLNGHIQKFTSSGIFITKWGTGGTSDGQFVNPMGLAVDAAGNVYVADTDNHRIQKFTSSGDLITKWGADGFSDSHFRAPRGVDVDTNGNVYVADTGNYRIQVFGTIRPLTVTTGNATNITSTSVQLNGTLNDLGSYSSASVYFNYTTEIGNMTATHPVHFPPGLGMMASPGSFSVSVTGLAPNTTYHFLAMATVGHFTDSGWYGDYTFYGGWLSFTTLADSVIAGDANGDGLVNALDITNVERIIVGLDPPTPGADANQDGNINALDITKVERIIARLD